MVSTNRFISIRLDQNNNHNIQYVQVWRGRTSRQNSNWIFDKMYCLYLTLGRIFKDRIVGSLKYFVFCILFMSAWIKEFNWRFERKLTIVLLIYWLIYHLIVIEVPINSKPNHGRTNCGLLLLSKCTNTKRNSWWMMFLEFFPRMAWNKILSKCLNDTTSMIWNLYSHDYFLPKNILSSDILYINTYHDIWSCLRHGS